MIKKAVILAAGIGSRMGLMTKNLPKCLIEFKAKPLLSYSLQALKINKISEVVIVVGYMANKIKEQYGDSFYGMKIRYIDNPEYATKDNIYSLWLAKEEMQENILLLEGDLYFESKILTGLINTDRADIAIVDSYSSITDGTVIRANNQLSNAMILKNYQIKPFDYSAAWKTVNIYKLSKTTLTNYFIPKLYNYIMNNNLQQYYEIVLADLIREGSIKLYIMPIRNCRWAEIDTLKDYGFLKNII